MNDFVLIEEYPYEPYNEFKGYSVVVPDKFKHGPEDRPVKGKVISKGHLCKDDSISVGMSVILGKWSGARIKNKPTDYILIKEEDILATY